MDRYISIYIHFCVFRQRNIPFHPELWNLYGLSSWLKHLMSMQDSSVQNRVKRLIDERFYGKAEAMLQYTGLSREDLRDFINAKRDFTLEQYGRIAGEAHVSLQWLLSGQGYMDLPSVGTGGDGMPVSPPKGEQTSPSVARQEPENTAQTKPRRKSAGRGRPRKQTALPAAGFGSRKSAATGDGIPVGQPPFDKEEFTRIWNSPSAFSIDIVHGEGEAHTCLMVPSAYSCTSVFGPSSDRVAFPVWEALIAQTANRGWNRLLCASRQSGLHDLFRSGCCREGREGESFHCVDFWDVSHSHRVNPLLLCADVFESDSSYRSHRGFMNSINILNFSESLIRSCFRYLHLTVEERRFLWKEFSACQDFLASVIDLLFYTDMVSYDAYGNKLTASASSPTSFVDGEGRPSEVAYSIGRYADLPHVIAFFMQRIEDILCAIWTVRKPAETHMTFYDLSWKDRNVAMRNHELDFFASILRKLASPEAFWVLSGSDFLITMRYGKLPRNLSICYDHVCAAAGGDVERTWCNVVLNAVVSGSTNCNCCVSEDISARLFKRPMAMMVDDICQSAIDRPDELLSKGNPERIASCLGIPSVEELRAVYLGSVADAIVDMSGAVVATPSCDNRTRREILSRVTAAPLGIRGPVGVVPARVTFLADKMDCVLLSASAQAPVSPPPCAGEVSCAPGKWEERVRANYDRILSESTELCRQMCRDTTGRFCRPDRKPGADTRSS